MDVYIYENVGVIAAEMISDLECNEIVTAVVYEDVARELIIELIKEGFIPNYINLDMCENSGYDDSYYISIDDAMNLLCEKSYDEEDDLYYGCYSDVTYFDVDVDLENFYLDSSGEIHRIISTEEYNKRFDSSECDGDCENCMYYDADDTEDAEDYEDTDEYKCDDDMYGFTMNTDTENSHSSMSFWSTDKEITKEIAKLYNIKTK